MSDRSVRSSEELLDELDAEAELAEIAALPKEQRHAELVKAGIKPGAGLAIVERLLAEADARAMAAPAKAAPAKVVSLAEARSRRSLSPATWGVIALAACILMTLGFVKRQGIRDQIEAWFSPAPTLVPPPIPSVPPTHEETPQEKAERLRQVAYVRIKMGYHDPAVGLLDEAKALDPAGEDTVAVILARGHLDNMVEHRENLVKPPIGPGERPLRPTPAPSSPGR